MARIRTIKPSFWTDDKVAGLTRDQRLLAVGLISFADDDGRFVGAVSAISGYVFPHDDLPSTTVRRWRDAVVKAGLIQMYTVDGRDYGWFPNWHKHQVINRPQQSTIPPPPDAPDPPPKRSRRPAPQPPDS